MKPRPGKPPQAVPPGPPDPPDDADQADPGKMAEVKARQVESKTGKYGRAPATPFKPGADGTDGDGASTSWIEVELVDEDDMPVPGEPYLVRMGGDLVAKGTLDENGWVRLEGIPRGTCEVSFPRLDADAWEFIESMAAKAPVPGAD